MIEILFKNEHQYKPNPLNHKLVTSKLKWSLVTKHVTQDQGKKTLLPMSLLGMTLVYAIWEPLTISEDGDSS